MKDQSAAPGPNDADQPQEGIGPRFSGSSLVARALSAAVTDTRPSGKPRPRAQHRRPRLRQRALSSESIGVRTVSAYTGVRPVLTST